MIANLEFILKITDQLSPAMQSAATVSEGAGTKIASSMKHIGVAAESATGGVNILRGGLTMLTEAVAPFLGAFAAFEFLKGTTEKFNEAAQSQAQLQASLMSTKGAAGLSTAALDEQAEALQKTTLYG